MFALLGDWWRVSVVPPFPQWRLVKDLGWAGVLRGIQMGSVTGVREDRNR